MRSLAVTLEVTKALADEANKIRSELLKFKFKGYPRAAGRYDKPNFVQLVSVSPFNSGTYVKGIHL